jgi:magnesium chelatase family protein
MNPRLVRKSCTLKPDAMSLPGTAMEELGSSARARYKGLRVARTIAAGTWESRGRVVAQYHGA